MKMINGSSIYRFDASSTLNANLREPLSGAALGSITLYRPARLRRVSIIAEAYLNDSAAGSWNAEARGRIYLTGSALFANGTPFGITVSGMNENQTDFDKVLPPGTYTVTGFLYTYPFHHPYWTDAGAGPVWNTCTVALIAYIEVEDL